MFALWASRPNAYVWVDLCRDALMYGGALLLRLEHVSAPLPAQLETGLRWILERARVPVIMTANNVDLDILRTVSTVVWPPLATEDQARLWEAELAAHIADTQVRKESIDYLTRAYQLHAGHIVETVKRAQIRRRQDKLPNLSIELLTKTLRTILEHDLGGLASVVESNMKLNEIVLPVTIREQIQEIEAWARHKQTVLHVWSGASLGHGRVGLSVLFSGEPGTGKTLCAAALGQSLGQVVYRVDLSRIVDKYIGETEKKLEKAFVEAERAQAILLFDEADSLFSKRTQVKSSNDRYANQEINFLLQRMESFDGICILTTNLADSLDDAFKRRLRFHVEFPLPTAEDRALLWQRLLPKGAPKAQIIDWAKLGERFKFSGGHIRNATLRASFLAAMRDQIIDTGLLLEAGTREARTLGELIRSA